MTVFLRVFDSGRDGRCRRARQDRLCCLPASSAWPSCVLQGPFPPRRIPTLPIYALHRAYSTLAIAIAELSRIPTAVRVRTWILCGSQARRKKNREDGLADAHAHTHTHTRSIRVQWSRGESRNIAGRRTEGFEPQLGMRVLQPELRRHCHQRRRRRRTHPTSHSSPSLGLPTLLEQDCALGVGPWRGASETDRPHGQSPHPAAAATSR